ncbi:MAG: BolA family protein [Mariprofundaceae bacterium]|nr:BolA family protein [Mariprofundaceae bacterium]
MMAVQIDDIKKLIVKSLPDAKVDVNCYSGDDHFEVTVVSSAFTGKNRILQHKMVYAALGDHMRAEIHALALKTRAS